jgi:hypothetical protein
MMDLRNANLPYEFTNAIANSMTIFKRAGINTGEIPHELQYFSSITEFKEVKAVVIATFYNAQISWAKVIENLKRREIKPKDLSKEDVEKIANECYVKPEFVQNIINALE